MRLYTENSYTAASGYGYDADGNVLGYHTITGGSGTVLNATPTAGTVGNQNAYIKQNGWLLATTTQVPTSGSSTVTTNNTYNDLGELASTTGTANGAAQTQVMAYTSGGQLLQKSATSNGSTTTTYYESVNENQLGSIDTAGTINVLSTSGGFGNGSTGMQSYTVQAGDTLQSLAQEIYGDSNYYYILAQANGLSPTASLPAGMQLKIPQVTTSANAYDTYQPYSAAADISGGASAMYTVAQLVATSIEAIFNQQSAIAQTVEAIEAQQREVELEQANEEQAKAFAAQQADKAAKAKQAASDAAESVKKAQDQAAQAQQQALLDQAAARTMDAARQHALTQASDLLRQLKGRGYSLGAIDGGSNGGGGHDGGDMGMHGGGPITGNAGGGGGLFGDADPGNDIGGSSGGDSGSGGVSLPGVGNSAASSAWQLVGQNDGSVGLTSGDPQSSDGGNDSGVSSSPLSNFTGFGNPSDPNSVSSSYSLGTAGTGVGDASDDGSSDWWNSLGGLLDGSLMTGIDASTLAQWQDLDSAYQTANAQYTSLDAQYNTDQTQYAQFTATATQDQSLYQQWQTAYQTASDAAQTANTQVTVAEGQVQDAQATVATLNTQLGQENDTGATLPSVATTATTSLAGVVGSSLGTTSNGFSDSQLSAYSQWLMQGNEPSDAGTLSQMSLPSDLDSAASTIPTFNGDGQSLMDPSMTDTGASAPNTLSDIGVQLDPILQHMSEYQSGLLGEGGADGSLMDRGVTLNGMGGPSTAAVGALSLVNSHITGGDGDWSIGAIKGIVNFLPIMANGAVKSVQNLSAWEARNDRLLNFLAPEAAKNAADAFSQTQPLQIPTWSYSNGVQAISGALTNTGLTGATLLLPGWGEENVSAGGVFRFNGGEGVGGGAVAAGSTAADSVNFPNRLVLDVPDTTVDALSGAGGSGAGDDLVYVYRGTNRVTENNVYAETGHILSDAAQRTYMETGSLDEAYAASDATHQQWVDIWGNEEQYAQAHGAFGTELKPAFGLDRTFISVTTDPAQAAYFSEGGTVYGGYVPKSFLVPQTLSGAGESELLLQGGTNLLKPIQLSH